MVTGTDDAMDEPIAFALDSMDTPHLVYVSGDDPFGPYEIKHIWQEGNNWVSEILDSVSAYDISLAVDGADHLHVGYWPLGSDITYAHRDAGGWHTEIVESGDGRIALDVDQQSMPRMIYLKVTTEDQRLLRYAQYQAYEPVQAEFSGTPTSGIVPLSVTFSNASTGDYADSLWQFGDAMTSTLESPTHVYTTTGVYTVSLTASGLGGSDTETKTAYITVKDYQKVFLPLVLGGYASEVAEADLYIYNLDYDGTDERVIIGNRGIAAQGMTDWKLHSAVGDQWYSFPTGFVLDVGSYVTVHSGPDAFENPPGDLFWSDGYFWNDDGDKAVLYDGSGQQIDSFCYKAGCP
jgi:PKD repeat protein